MCVVDMSMPHAVAFTAPACLLSILNPFTPRMNDVSSRSHAILMVTLEQHVLPSAASSLDAEQHHLRSKLVFVDLAGCERQRETEASGMVLPAVLWHVS